MKLSTDLTVLEALTRNRVYGDRSGMAWSKILGILLMASGALLCGCHPGGASRQPSLQITRVPPADPGGPLRLDNIEGRAIGARSGQQVVIYTYSGVWWVQPYKKDPFTRIQADATWKNSTHLGTEYAALLVEPSYHPKAKLSALPAVGGGVVAVATAKGMPSATAVAPKIIHFSGYDWKVHSADSDRGGETNSYDAANAWTDDRGYLHLRMALIDGKWSCAEVALARSLGFGTYRFVVQDSAHLGLSAVVGLFTFDENAADESRNELDIS
jgi:hypothetical protein